VEDESGPDPALLLRSMDDEASNDDEPDCHMLDLISVNDGKYDSRRRTGTHSFGSAVLPFRSCIEMRQKPPSPMRRNVDHVPLD
jgi:hypothetical protein